MNAAIADWILERRVNASNHAEVFFARRGGVAAALKLARGGDRPTVLRSAREAAALRRIDHPCVAPLLDAGFNADGTPYVATRWIDGDVLEDRLAAGPMSWRELAPMLEALATGLGALHAAGVVHRDLKPSNVIVPASGDPPAVILDLGHAALHGDARITHTGTTVGSLLYMAPEQVRGGAVDGRADLYALGVMLYRALCGRVPFASEHVLRGELDLVPARRRVPELPPAVDDLCRWLLATKASERLPSATVLVATLQSITMTRVR
jgi:serine/threonine protein kinase